MEKLIGRVKEKAILQQAFASPSVELVAIYGRRRVGKTFLVHSIFEKNMIFAFSGSHGNSTKEQLHNFSREMTRVAGITLPLAVPADWGEAFMQLQTWLSPQLTSGRKVLFFDELPWLDTPRSKFLSAFSYFWNSWAVKQNHLLTIICGSAVSWMIKNVVNNKGGLHNRITQTIRLLPFTLAEAENYLKNRHVQLDRYQVLQIYMAMGGIPHYLKNIKPGESAAQGVDRTCFTKDSVLRDEFGKLYSSLFDHADDHMEVIRALAKKGKGLTRNQIINACSLTNGGTTTTRLKELVESGFISTYVPFGKTTKDTIYKLTDEYSLFYLRYIEGSKPSADTWLHLASSPSWKSWSGIAFECICLKHTEQVKKHLGIAGVRTTESVWRFVEKNISGAQIDLLIDRSDHTINLCEMKYSESEYLINNTYAAELKRKKEIFKKETKTKKTVFVTMLTTFGVQQNKYFHGYADNQLTMDALFD
jgi:hypothetical protein